MLEAVFISDLHLSPEDPIITERFLRFTDWAMANTKKLYILGDFFHAWPGDDGIDAFALSIIRILKTLKEQGLKVYFMPGNRDFLVGKKFLQESGLELLKDPCLIYFENEPVLLSHGDRYCTEDKSHQWLMLFTRNKLFSLVFQLLPLKFRNKIVGKARELSTKNKKDTMKNMDTVDSALIAALKKAKARTFIHGHTHKPGFRTLKENNKQFSLYILSDWDDKPKALCYDVPVGFYFVQDFSLSGGKNGKSKDKERTIG